MGNEYPAKTFKSGNSVALRLPKALGIKEGMEMKVREERGNLIVEPALARDAKIDLSGIYGSVPGIRRPPCDENRGIGTLPRDMAEPIFLIDTNICIYLLDGRGDRVRQRFESSRRGEMVTSAIVRAEVMLGAKAQGQIDRAEALFAQIEALPFDARAADCYAAIPFFRGNLDRFIGAHALSLGLTLVTSNERDFEDIPGLKIENWTR